MCSHERPNVARYLTLDWKGSSERNRTAVGGLRLDEETVPGRWSVCVIHLEDHGWNRTHHASPGRLHSGHSRQMPTGAKEFTVVNDGADNTAPTISNIELITPMVDVTEGDGTVVVEFDVEETGSGVDNAPYVLFQNGRYYVNPTEQSDSSVSRQHYRATIRVPKGHHPGEYPLSVGAVDRLDNEAIVAGPAVTIANADADVRGPTAVSVELLTPVVDKQVSRDFRMRARVTDEGVGVMMLGVSLVGPSGQVSEHFGATLVSGDGHDGIWEVSGQLAVAAEAGPWTVRFSGFDSLFSNCSAGSCHRVRRGGLISCAWS